MGLPWEGGQGVKRAPTTARTRGRWSRATLLRGTVCIQSARRKRREKQRSVSGLKHDGRATPSRLPGMNLPGRTSQETGDTGTVQTGPAPCRGRRCKEPGKTCRGAGRWGGRRLQGRGPRQSQPRASRKPRAVSCPGGPFTDDTLTRSEEPWWGRRSKPCRPREEGQRARRERVAAGRSRPEAHGWGRAWFTARPGRPHSNRCSRVLEAARTAHLQLERSSLTPGIKPWKFPLLLSLSWHPLSASRILVPRPGVEPAFPAVGAEEPHPLNCRGVPPIPLQRHQCSRLREGLLPCLRFLARPVRSARIFLGSAVSLDPHQQICKARDQMGLPRERKQTGSWVPPHLAHSLMQKASRILTEVIACGLSAWFPDASPGTPGGVLIYFPLKWVMMASHFSVDSILRSTEGVRVSFSRTHTLPTSKEAALTFPAPQMLQKLSLQKRGFLHTNSRAS